MTSEFVRIAILGTGQVPPSASDETNTAVDELVRQITGIDRERAFLLRAGALAAAKRGATTHPTRGVRPDAAPDDVLSLPSERLEAILSGLLTSTNVSLLEEALVHMARAGVRWPTALLPGALDQTRTDVRQKLLPVLDARGRWLARRRPEWAWAVSPAVVATEAPTTDLDARWEAGTSSERLAWLASLLRADRPHARALIAAGMKSEKAEHRLAWVQLLAEHPSPDDEALLASMLTDRSGHVRTCAARALWCLTTSDLALRMRARCDTLLSFDGPKGFFGKMRAFMGGASEGTLRVELPSEQFREEWTRDGLVESPPQGTGRRQWWLAQLVSAVPPGHWSERFGTSPEAFLHQARSHELAEAVVDGLTAAALRHDAKDWFAPLWDAWFHATVRARLVEHPLAELAARLGSEDAAPRMRQALASGRVDLLRAFPGPWPASFAAQFLQSMSEACVALTPVLDVAALAIPLEVLPEVVSVPELDASDWAAQQYLRSLDAFRVVTSTRRALLQEIPP